MRVTGRFDERRDRERSLPGVHQVRRRPGQVGWEAHEMGER